MNDPKLIKKHPSQKLVVAVSSSALFDLSESHEVYLNQGLEAYTDYQLMHEKEILKPGQAFRLVNKLLKLNNVQPDLVEVILLSRNSSATGMRVFNSINAYQLPITRAAFCSGSLPYRYANAFNCDLYLSGHSEDVQLALQNGIAAAQIMGSAIGGDFNEESDLNEHELRIAFDGDAVLFSDASEVIYKTNGLAAFTEHEQLLSQQPMTEGPFKRLLEKLHYLQQALKQQGLDSPIKTALVTARSAPAHERVIRTLSHWGLKVDEALFLGGMPKGAFLKAFNSDIFFDDQLSHCLSVAEHVPAGHVLHGIANQPGVTH